MRWRPPPCARAGLETLRAMILREPRNIVITGASGAIGRALAVGYAGPGRVLGLTGRDAARLDAVAEACRDRGARVETVQLDVRDFVGLMAWIAAFDERNPVDLIIANAGIAGATALAQDGESWESLRGVFDTNLYGALAAIHPLLELMGNRGHGQIALMSSLAAHVGMPITSAYSASKGALKTYGEALRGRLKDKGVGVSVICPGFVDSPMSLTYPGPTPFRIDADHAARLIRRGLRRNRACIEFPVILAFAMRALAFLPVDWRLYLMRLFRF